MGQLWRFKGRNDNSKTVYNFLFFFEREEDLLKSIKNTVHDRRK